MNLPNIARRIRPRLDTFARKLHCRRGLVMWQQRMLDQELEGNKAFELLRDCSLFRTYQDAFKVATGLPLQLIQKSCMEDKSCSAEQTNEFCKILNENGICPCCKEANQILGRQAKEETKTISCFAGMKETAIPIQYAGRTLAFLKTGEVLTHQPGDRDFEHIAGVLLGQGKSGAEITLLRKAYFDSPVVEGARYQGMVVLLATFGRQLTEHLKDLILSRTEETPVPIRKAVEYIERNLDGHLGLDDVAVQSGLSVSQFCKVFKETTGVTFTEHVNRRRIEWARRELLRPGARVTEVAYKVGFTSLSQFNRSFLRFVGEAPRDYRKRRLLEVA